MRLYRNQLSLRLLGTAVGLGFVLIGAFALLGAGDNVPELTKDRAAGFGLTAVIGGVWAIWLSWLAKDLSGIWCCHPRRR